MLALVFGSSRLGKKDNKLIKLAEESSVSLFASSLLPTGSGAPRLYELLLTSSTTEFSVDEIIENDDN
jgi:hypothetical protein